MLGTRRSLLLAAMGLNLAACSQTLTERSVTEFIDAADQAFLDGNAADLCGTRSENFLLTTSDLDLTGEKIVADLKEAEAVAAEREAAGERVAADVKTVDRKSLCFDSMFEARTYRMATLRRGKLEIHIDPDGRRAVVRTHYSVRMPVIQAADSTLGPNDTVQQQVATRQSESDDESVLIVDEDGDIVFDSTKATSRSFLIPSQHDSRI